MMQPDITDTTALERYLIEAAAHVLRAAFRGADDYWISACAELQVLGQERTALPGKDVESCREVLATFEARVGPRGLPFLPAAQKVVIGDQVITAPQVFNVGAST